MRANNSMLRTGVLTLFLSGCAGAPPPITVDEPAPPVVCTQDPRPDLLNLKDTPPRVVLDAETGTWGYWFGTDLYASLAENLQAMRRHMRQLRARGTYFQKCIDDHNRRLAESKAGE